MRLICVLLCLLNGVVAYAEEVEQLFICHIDGQTKVEVVGKHDKSGRSIKVESTVPSINSFQWLDAKLISGAIYSTSYSRSVETVLFMKNINGCEYTLEDSLIARRISDIPSHDKIKTFDMKCQNNVSNISVKCAGVDDGIKQAAYKYFPLKDMEEWVKD